MNGWSDPDRRQRDRGRWLAADAGLAVLFAWITVASLQSDAYVDEYGAVQGAGWLLALAPNALLLVRRYAPVITLVTATLLYLAASVTQGDSNAPLAIPFFAYSVGFTRPIPISATIVGAAALTLCTTTFYGPGDPDPLVIVVWFLLFGAGWLVAVSIRGEQTRADHLTDTVDELQAHQDHVAAAAAFDERSRIARELHDAVGHAVNVMVLQAGAARLSQQPDKAFGALREIEGLGRTVLTDLDHMLGLLHDSGAPVRGPAQNIADIATMVAEMQAAGADITLRNDCEVAVGRNVGAAAYRIAQEALTNALKHAGVAHVDVTLSCTETHLHLSVVDDGQAKLPTGPTGGGRGIAGMTERAKVLGGRLTAGRLDGGGFAVETVLPLGYEQRSRTAAAEARNPATS